jgi:hypothetical protein
MIGTQGSVIVPVAQTFSIGGTIMNPIDTITAAIDSVVWIATRTCTVTSIKGFRIGGTGATINAGNLSTGNHLASHLSLVNASTVYDGGAVQSTSYTTGQVLKIYVISVSGGPTQITIQVNFTY